MASLSELHTQSIIQRVYSKISPDALNTATGLLKAWPSDSKTIARLATCASTAAASADSNTASHLVLLLDQLFKARDAASSSAVTGAKYSAQVIVTNTINAFVGNNVKVTFTNSGPTGASQTVGGFGMAQIKLNLDAPTSNIIATLCHEMNHAIRLTLGALVYPRPNEQPFSCLDEILGYYVQHLAFGGSPCDGKWWAEVFTCLTQTPYSLGTAWSTLQGMRGQSDTVNTLMAFMDKYQKDIHTSEAMGDPTIGSMNDPILLPQGTIGPPPAPQASWLLGWNTSNNPTGAA